MSFERIIFSELGVGVGKRKKLNTEKNMRGGCFLPSIIKMPQNLMVYEQLLFQQHLLEDGLGWIALKL